MQRHFESSKQLLEHLSKQTDSVILGFSRGKESICCWLELKKYFKNIYPYHLDVIPNLKFVEESLKYFENYFNQKIERYTHPSFYRLLDNDVFQTPETSKALKNISFYRHLDYKDIQEDMRFKYNIPDALTAIGIRQADSPLRFSAINKHGSISYKLKQFYPLFDWKKSDIIKCIKENNINLPIDYKIFGMSFDGIDYRFMKPLRDNLPEDFHTIKTFFPLIELDILRRQDGKQTI